MNAVRTFPSIRRQSGSALFVSMILLVLLTLIVISIIKATNVNSKVAGNMQIQKEEEAATQKALETVIATNFMAAPAATTVPIDFNNDGTTDYSVAVAVPTCTTVSPVKLSDLDVANPDDLACFASGAGQNTGIKGAGATGNSLCSNTEWEVHGTASDSHGSAATVTTHQGVAVRVAVGTSCP